MAACFEQTLEALDPPETGGPSSHRAFLLAGMPQELAGTFTETQLAAIQRMLEERLPGEPRVDIRLSIPLLRRRCFLVFLAGSERRSPGRRRQDRPVHRLWTLANVCVLSFALLLLIPAFIGMSHMVVTLASN